MIQDCLEQILDDVIRVDLVLASTCHFGVPFLVSKESITVSDLSNWTPQSSSHAVIGKAELSVAYDEQDGDDGLMEPAPKLKQPSKTVAWGLMVSHDLQVPVVRGFETMAQAAKHLHRRDFHVILTTAGGTMYLLYALPNTSEVLLDETDVHQEATLKISLKSASHVIRLE